MPHIITIGFSHEHALEMAKEALDGVLMTSLDNNLTIVEPTYKGGYPIEVSAKIAFAYKLRTSRNNRTQSEILLIKYNFYTIHKIFIVI